MSRSRRSLLKAAAITMGALAATSAAPRQAAAQWWCFWCGGESGGGGTTGGGGTPTCFLRGTRIRTIDGYRPIEELAVGDRVAARFAGTAPIKFIESFTLARSGPRREWLGHCRPVTVRQGALGEGMPGRDLCLTAAHAVYVGGFLMPIGQLVNGTSIVLERADGHDTLDFFHIELERHDVLDAEGAPCESRIAPFAETCAPMLSFGGGRGELRSRLRSAAALVVDRRHPIDLIRDGLEERGLALARAA
ncbi:MAG TPA: Hint domain-containing protein [Reyranella sp.]|nr:Hint domain-containing protein [Reyranella sp.]